MATWKRAVRKLIRRPTRVAGLGEGAVLPAGSTTGRPFTMGAYASASGPVSVGGVGELSIGPWAAIGIELRVIKSNHDTNRANMHGGLQALIGAPNHFSSKGPVAIGPASWIGDRVTVLSGSTIGAGAVVAAGSVVTGEIPPFTVAAGVPARVLRSRFEAEMTAFLLEVAWWDWPIERIERNAVFFALDLTGTSVGDARAAIV